MIKDSHLTDKALIKQLLKQIEQLTARVKELESVKVENKLLSDRVSELEERLSKYENPKNSGNSRVALHKILIGRPRVCVSNLISH